MDPYTAEITGNYSVKMTSMVDQHVGIDICREFFLDSTSNQLRIRHIMTNRSARETSWYFWDRIFSPIGGKVMIHIKTCETEMPVKTCKAGLWRRILVNHYT